jgi:hypothetical protein
MILASEKLRFAMQAAAFGIGSMDRVGNLFPADRGESKRINVFG